MKISILVAVAENGVIGLNNQLIWHLPDDLKFFKGITLNKSIIMGRKTFESIGKPLPQRKNIVITGNPNFVAEGCVIVNSLTEALTQAEGEEAMIVGGATIYLQAMKMADTIYLTQVHHHFKGDTYFPPVDTNIWEQVERTDRNADEKHAYNFSFITYKRKEYSRV